MSKFRSEVDAKRGRGASMEIVSIYANTLCTRHSLGRVNFIEQTARGACHSCNTSSRMA
jgi:hypothetical protein